MGRQCFECYSKDINFYCCCQQVFLCINCLLPHQNHLILEEDLNFNRIDDISILLSYLKEFSLLELEAKQLIHSSNPENDLKKIDQNINSLEKHIKNMKDS
jgi:hypothetical protein